MPFLSVASAPVTGGLEPALHAADRFLSVPISLLFWAISAIVIGIAVRKTNRQIDEKMVPLMGVMAAFIFAAQMFNFQVAGGTSGHLLGGVLAAVLLGPWAATLVMASVIAVQGLVFSDGGLVVMGANIFNMGIVGHARRVLDLPHAGDAVRRRGPGPRAGGGHRRLAVRDAGRGLDVADARRVRHEPARRSSCPRCSASTPSSASARP